MTSANVPRVRTALQRSPNQSRLGQEAGCCRATVNRIARVQLWALPQNVFIHQILTESYKTARQHFCASFIRKLEQKYDLVKELRYSDETHFHVDSKSKSKKFGFWLHVKSDLVAEAPLFSARRMRHDHWAAEPSSSPTSSKTSAATRRPAMLSGTGRCWRNFGGPFRLLLFYTVFGNSTFEKCCH